MEKSDGRLTYEEMYARHSGKQQGGAPHRGANVKFFIDRIESQAKTLEAGIPQYDYIPSISIQYPGHDITVTRIEPHHIAQYPEEHRRFLATQGEVEIPSGGLSLLEWTKLPRSGADQLIHLGFLTVEQVAAADDHVKSRLGTLGKYVKMAQEWLAAANSKQSDVVKLKEQVEKLLGRCEKLEEQNGLLIKRIETTEGTRLS